MLGSIRLSNLTDETTSPERQEQIISRSAELADKTVVHWARDLDVSASTTHPLERPSLSKFFQEPLLYEWDEIRFWRLDRFIRSVSDLADMIKWCREHGKNIASATEPFDMSTPIGEAMVYLTAIFAQLEVRTTSERVSGTRKFLREKGRWAGGRPPYGYLPVPNPKGKGWILDIDPVAQAQLKDAWGRIVLDGESQSSITASWNQRGIPSPADRWRQICGRELRNERWHQKPLESILRSAKLLGYEMKGGKPVRDSKGMPIMAAPAIFTQAEFDQLQEALDRQSRAKSRTRKTTLLLNVSSCILCQGPHYGRTYKTRGQEYSYYFCRGRKLRTCNAPSIEQAWLDDAVEDSLLDKIGDKPVLRRQYVPAVDHTEDLKRARRALNEVREEKDSGLYDYPGGSEEYKQRIIALASRVNELAKLPQREAKWDYIPTGETYAEAWGRMDTVERRQLLLNSGITVKAKQFECLLFVPPDLLERLKAAQK